MFTFMVLVDLILVILAIAVIIYGYILWIFRHWERKGIPYFEPTFPLGNIPGLHKDISATEVVFDFGKKAKKEGWKYFGLYLSTAVSFVPLDVEIIKNILFRDFGYFTDRGFYFDEKHDPLTANLFTVGGTKWKNLRAKFTPTFTSKKLKEMFQTVINGGLLLENFLKECDRNQPVDIKHASVCFTIDIIGSCAFGLDCNTFKEPNSPFLTYNKKLFGRNVIDQFKPLVANSFPRLAKILRLKTIPEDVTKFFTDIVTETVNFREQSGLSRKDFLQTLIDMKNNDTDETVKKGTLNMTEIISQCFIIFVAGFETSSITMTFALYELSVNSEIQNKVRDELFQVLKKYDNEICYDALQELHYMQQVIDETLRKYPALPFVTRQCSEDYKIPDTDIMLEKGTNIIIPVQNIHYDENIYENPMEFNPSRFSTENKNNRNTCAHIPFGEGPRMCIGLRFGIMQIKVGLATVLRSFRLELNPKTKVPIEIDTRSLVLRTKRGVWLNFKEL